MKKAIISLFALLAFYGINTAVAEETVTPQPVVTIEIPADQVENIDVKYKNQTSTTEKVKAETNKTISKTKEMTDKTVKATKKFTKDTVDNTKEAIDNLNPNKPVTLASIEKKAAIKKLKIERDAKKAAYNSKIKDIKAQTTAAEYSTTITDVQRQNKIYTLNKEKQSLIEQRDAAIKEYNAKINEIRNNK